MENLTAINLLKSYVRSLSSNESILDVVRKNLTDHSLYEPVAVMGGIDNAGEIIAQGIITSDIKAINAQDAMQSSLSTLQKMHEQKQKRLNLIFILCLIAISVSIALIAIGLILVFVSNKERANVGLVTSASSLLTSLLGGTAFLFFDKIKKESEGVEKEIIKLNKLVIFFGMIDNIPDQEVRNDSFRSIIEQME